MNNKIYMQVGPVIYEKTFLMPFQVRDEYKEFFFSSLKEIKDHEKSRIIRCQIKMVHHFSNIQGDLIYENPERMIFSYQGREFRLHAGIKGVCGIYRESEDDENSIEIQLSDEEFHQFEINTVFLEMLALERHLLKENALVLHSSYILWENQGIVFTAPSGTGKSTQAELWRCYKGAQIINGDRSVLWWNPVKEQFYVCGLPFCGSSGIRKNISAPLRAVVFLSQALQNQVWPCPSSESIRKMFGEISINQWNPKAVEKSLTLIEKISKTVPMIRLACNMEPEVADILADILNELPDKWA